MMCINGVALESSVNIMKKGYGQLTRGEKLSSKLNVIHQGSRQIPNRRLQSVSDMEVKATGWLR